MCPSYERIIDIFARDRNGRSIPNARIQFAINGHPAGEVTSTEGRARIQLQSRNSKIQVSATYQKVTLTETLSEAQDHFTFTFDVDVGTGALMERHIALVVGLGLIGIAISLAFVFTEPTPLQIQIIRSTFSLAGGAIATEISGMINVNLTLGTKLKIAATGALAIFVVLFFFIPA